MISKHSECKSVQPIRFLWKPNLCWPAADILQACSVCICGTGTVKQDENFIRITPSWPFVYNILLPDSCLGYLLHAPVAVHQMLSRAPVYKRCLLPEQEAEEEDIICEFSWCVTNADRWYRNKWCLGFEQHVHFIALCYLCLNGHLWQWVNAHKIVSVKCVYAACGISQDNTDIWGLWGEGEN